MSVAGELMGALHWAYFGSLKRKASKNQTHIKHAKNVYSNQIIKRVVQMIRNGLKNLI